VGKIGYNNISETGRGHASVNHSQKEWARDDDAMASGKSIATLWRVYGPDFAIFYALFVEFTNSICLFILQYLKWHITKNG
jgi:hypothetical protein